VNWRSEMKLKPVLLALFVVSCARVPEGSLFEITNTTKTAKGWRFDVVPNQNGKLYSNDGVRFSGTIYGSQLPSRRFRFKPEMCRAAGNSRESYFSLANASFIDFSRDGRYISVAANGRVQVTCEDVIDDCVPIVIDFRASKVDSDGGVRLLDSDMIQPIRIALCGSGPTLL
jgi:hypothetical protein